MITEKIKAAVRDIPDFPKEGILFKDITPILKDYQLCHEIVDEFCIKLHKEKIDVVVGIESRGFLFGMLIAQKLKVPFVPIRKQGKLPGDVVAEKYDLEYGTATIEIHKDAFAPGKNILIHDDLLATGGTTAAAGKLVEKLKGNIVFFSFLIELKFLNGRERILPFSENILTLAEY
jgi:adenine phosphoribosyltransferase